MSKRQTLKERLAIYRSNFIRDRLPTQKTEIAERSTSDLEGLLARTTSDLAEISRQMTTRVSPWYFELISRISIRYALLVEAMVQELKSRREIEVAA